MKNLKLKIIHKLGIAIAITLFFKLLFFRIEEFLDWDILFVVVIVILIWKGNEAIDKWLNTKYNWMENARKSVEDLE